MVQGTWTLQRGGRVIGSIDTDPALGDFPWIGGWFRPHDGFEEVESMFAALVVAAEEDDWDEWDRIFDGIVAAGVSLHDDRGVPMAEFMMGIEDGQARFRFSEEPFDEPVE